MNKKIDECVREFTHKMQLQSFSYASNHSKLQRVSFLCAAIVLLSILFSVEDETCMIPNVINAMIAPFRTSYYNLQKVKIVCDEGFLMNTSVTRETSAATVYCGRSAPTGVWTNVAMTGQVVDIVGCFRAYYVGNKLHGYFWRMS